jgi:transposase-like protein
MGNKKTVEAFVIAKKRNPGFSGFTKDIGNFHRKNIEKQRKERKNGTFEPVIVPKHEKRVPLFNDQIISMYSFGMSDRNIQKHLEQVYNVEVSPDLISRVTNDVIEEVRE